MCEDLSLGQNCHFRSVLPSPVDALGPPAPEKRRWTSAEAENGVALIPVKVATVQSLPLSRTELHTYTAHSTHSEWISVLFCFLSLLCLLSGCNPPHLASLCAKFWIL